MARYRKKTRKNMKPRLIRKTRKPRKTGGGKEEKSLFNIWRTRHEYISKIGPHKPVATPHSGSDFSKALQLWNALSGEDKSLILEKIGITAYITPNPDKYITANPIFFYSPKYLQKLSEASDRSIEELLELVANVQKVDSLENDIIKIAFGDLYGLGPDPNPIQTEEGELIRAKYESLLEMT
jgi:hypothetical protein